MEIVTLVIFAVLTLYIIMLYNSLVSVKNNIAKAWSNIEILLKQRHDELPKLIDTCKQYMKHEQDTLERVMLARSQVSKAQQSHDVNALGTAEGALRTGLGHLFAVAEAYPELKANESFLHLQSRISGLENGSTRPPVFFLETRFAEACLDPDLRRDDVLIWAVCSLTRHPGGGRGPERYP